MKEETPPKTAASWKNIQIWQGNKQIRVYKIEDGKLIFTSLNDSEPIRVTYDEPASQFASTPTSKQEGEARRELHSITEDEVVELLTLVELIEDVSKNTPDDIEWVKENSYWSKSPLVGEKYLFHKHIDALGEQNIYFTRSWEQKGMEDTDAGIWPYHISIGEVRGPYGDCYKIIPVVEWFVSKGFKVGNLSLSATQQEGRREEAVRELIAHLESRVKRLAESTSADYKNGEYDAYSWMDKGEKRGYKHVIYELNDILAASIPPNKGKEEEKEVRP